MKCKLKKCHIINLKVLMHPLPGPPRISLPRLVVSRALLTEAPLNARALLLLVVQVQSTLRKIVPLCPNSAIESIRIYS